MSLEKILFIPDSHHPFSCESAYSLMISASKYFKPDHVIILGDFADFYSVSSHSKDPNRVNHLEEEVQYVIGKLKEIKSLGAKNNVFVEGNHENRLTRYLSDKAPELFNSVSVDKILQLKQLGFKFIPYKDSYKIGKINITHDVGSAGSSAVKKALDTFQHSIIIGHIHRIIYMVEGNATGEHHVGASFGWLGDDEQIDYMHKVKVKRDWSLGFGTGYLDTETGIVYVVPIPIINNTCVVEGKLITLNKTKTKGKRNAKQTKPF